MNSSNNAYWRRRPRTVLLNSPGLDQLQELVRLHRMGAGARQVARLLGMSPNTEWDYRRALEQAGGVLGRDPNELPSLTELQRLVARYRPNKPMPQQLSTVARDEPLIEHMLQAGAQPQAIYDLVRTRDLAFCGSLSAIKRSSISSARPSSLRDATPSRRAMASSYH